MFNPSNFLGSLHMVAGDEILLFYFRADNQFGFHTVGTDLRRGKVLGFTAQRVAVAVNQ